MSVIRAARRKLKKAARTSRAMRDARHQFYRLMLQYHADARATYRDVMRGTYA